MVDSLLYGPLWGRTSLYTVLPFTNVSVLARKHVNSSLVGTAFAQYENLDSCARKMPTSAGWGKFSFYCEWNVFHINGRMFANVNMRARQLCDL